MKKIFSFFVAKGLNTTPTNRLLCKVAIFVLVALFALPVMAGTIDVLDNSWIVDHHEEWGGSSYNSETKTITFGGGWAGCGWNLADMGLSTSEWLSITVEFTSTAPKGVLKCEYTDGTNEENFEGKTSQTLNFASGKTLNKIYLQLESSGTLTLTSAVVTTSTTTYTVSVTSSNGTVSGTGDFAEGAEVTLTASPNANYSFTGWSSSDISIAEASANPLVFTMPAKAVSVTANFSPCSGQTVTVNVKDEDMGSATGGGSYCAGVQVDLEATPKSGYRFVNWTVTSGSASLDNVNNASTHFTMSNPAAAVTVQANFEEDPCTNTKTVQCVSGYVPVTIHDHANQYVENKHETYVVTTGGNNVSAYYYPLSLSTTISSFTLSIHMANSQYDYAWFNLYKKTANNSGDVEYGGAYYNKVGWQHMVSGNWWHSDEFDDAITSFADGSEGVGSSIPSGDYLLALSAKNDARFYYFTLTTSENIFCPNTITMAKSGDDGAAAPTAQVNSSNVTTAFEGTVVTVTAAAASANHYFSGWTVLPENAVTFANQKNATTTFVMPAEDVTITANYGEVVSSKFTYTTSGSGTIDCTTANGSDVPSGTKIEMTAVPSTDYIFTGWTATAGTFGDDAALTTTFTMPAEAAEVTANFAQVDNVISQGSETGSDKGNSGGGASIAESHIADFDAFGHNVVKLTYSNMSGSSAYCGWNIGKSDSYNPASSSGATGFGFYYKTEAADDAVAMWFDPNTDNHDDQRGMQLPATENVWKYVYIEHAVANGWNRDNIIIYINGEQESKSTAHASGAIYIADIAATSITSKPEIANYHYTNNRGGVMQVNEYGTLCLPMGGTIDGATLYSVAGKETGDISYLVLEDKGTSVEAGKPYITQSTDISYTVTMSGPHSAVQAGNGLVGTYETINLTPYAEPSTLNYVLNQNAFKKAGNNVTVGAYRAYLNWGAVSAAPAPAQSARRIRMVIEGKEVQTGMETVTAMPKTTKVLIDGQLFIIREGKRYTLTGARAQ